MLNVLCLLNALCIMLHFDVLYNCLKEILLHYNFFKKIESTKISTCLKTRINENLNMFRIILNIYNKTYKGINWLIKIELISR